MRTVKLSWALPVAQFILSVGLLLVGRYYPDRPKGMDTPYAATATMVSHGLSAPAEIFPQLRRMFFPYEVDTAPFTLLGLDADDFAFLLGVVFVWYLVDRFFDAQKGFAAQEKNQSIFKSAVVNGLLILWGTYVLIVCVNSFGSPLRFPNGGNFIGNLADGILFLLWSVALILIPGRQIVLKFLRTGER